MKKAALWIAGGLALIGAVVWLESIPEARRLALMLFGTIVFLYYKLDKKIEAMAQNKGNRCNFSISVHLKEFGEVTFQSGVILLPIIPTVGSRIAHSYPKKLSDKSETDEDTVDFQSGEIVRVDWKYHRYECTCKNIGYEDGSDESVSAGMIIRDFENMGWSLSGWDFKAKEYYEKWSAEKTSILTQSP